MNSINFSGFHIDLVSESDIEGLLVEIYYGNFLIGVISGSQKALQIEFYSHPKVNFGQDRIAVNIDDFFTALNKAKDLVINPPSFDYNP